jgi:hypothetical protein
VFVTGSWNGAIIVETTTKLLQDDITKFQSAKNTWDRSCRRTSTELVHKLLELEQTLNYYKAKYHGRQVVQYAVLDAPPFGRVSEDAWEKQKFTCFFKAFFESTIPPLTDEPDLPTSSKAAAHTP